VSDGVRILFHLILYFKHRGIPSTKFMLYSFIQVQARSLVPFQIIDLWAFQIPTSFQVIVD